MQETARCLTVYKVHIPYFQKQQGETQIQAMGRYLNDTVIGKYQGGGFDRIETQVVQMHPYSLRVYLRVVSKTSPHLSTLKALGASEEDQRKMVKASSHSLIFFLYRDQPRECFALTSNQGFQPILPHADFAFSREIARLFLEPKVKEITQLPLVGKEVAKIGKYSEGLALAEQGLKLMYRVIRSFASPIKEASTLFTLEFLSNERPFWVEIGKAKVKINRAFTLSQYAQILEKFADALRANQLGDPNWTCLDWIRPVGPQTRVALDAALKRLIYQDSDAICDLYLVGSYYNDYNRAQTFTVAKGGAVWKTWKNSSPTAQEMLALLRGKLQGKTEQEFTQELGRLSLTYGKKSNRLVNCFQGEIEHEKQRYFRVLGHWYLTKPTFMTRVAVSFRTMLHGHLIKDNHPGRLPHVWPVDAKGKVRDEKVYNNLYLKQAGFLYGDEIYESDKAKIEVFDLLQVKNVGNQQHLFFYQVKSELGQNTRYACVQIQDAVEFVDRVKLNPAALELTFDRIAKSGSQAKKQVFAGMQKLLHETDPKELKAKFVNLFRNTPRKNIWFVYAFVNKTSDKKWLEKEPDPQHVFTDAELSKFGDNVVQVLIQCDVLQPNGQLADSVRVMTADDFKKVIGETDLKCKAKLLKFLRDRSCSQYLSLAAKLSLIRLSQKFQKKPYNFGIYQIPREEKLSNANK